MTTRLQQCGTPGAVDRICSSAAAWPRCAPIAAATLDCPRASVPEHPSPATALDANVVADRRAAAELACARAKQTGRAVLVVAATPVAPTSLDQLVATARADEDAVVWHAPDGAAYAGRFALLRFVASGDDRFEEIAAQVQAACADAVVVVGAVSRADLRAYGGLGFESVDTAIPAPLAPFDVATLVLHRRAVLQEHDRCVALSIECASPTDTPADVLTRWAWHADQAADGDPLPISQPPSWVAAPAEAFEQAVSQAIEAIEGGTVQKVVLSRVARLPLAAAPEPARVLARLDARFPGCWRYWFGPAAGPAFVGASPELLLDAHGSAVRTMALAGTASLDPAAPELAEAHLLQSEKERLEHEVVADVIRARLAGWTQDVASADTPQVLQAGAVAHLYTPFCATLQAGRTAAGLLAALHPTPAVGGRPQGEALRLLAKIEGHRRGWYAGPVGWMGANGDLQMAVALRSAWVGPGEARLVAGAGIVHGSEPARELRETRLKMEAMAWALGPADPGEDA